MGAAERAPTTALRDLIRDRARALGFDAVGFAAAALPPSVEHDFTAYLAEADVGDMTWLRERADERVNPRRLWSMARTAIVVGTSYAPADDRRDRPPADVGDIAAYARNRDYHDVIKGRLKMLAQTVVKLGGGVVKVFVDTAPVMEKPLGMAAGLGWTGKHTNMVSRQFGSWLLLGEILTTIDIPADPPGANRCGRCHACLDACPTQAFSAPYRLDPQRCIAYLTIEHKGTIPEAVRPMIGNRIYGCDDCLAACPWNRFAKASREAAFLPRSALTAPKLAELSRLDDDGFRALFSASPIKRIGRDRFLRNVLIAIGNSGDQTLLAAAERCRTDPAVVVGDTARWAVYRLTSKAGRVEMVP